MLTNKDKSQIKSYIKLISTVRADIIQNSQIPFEVAEIVINKSAYLSKKLQGELIDEVLAYTKKLLVEHRKRKKYSDTIPFKIGYVLFERRVRSALKHLIKINEDFWNTLEKQFGQDYCDKLKIRGKPIEKIIDILENEKYKVTTK